MILTKSKIIKAPIEFVWTVISDLPLMGELTPACTKIEVLSEQTKGVGTETLWHSRVHPEQASKEEIIEWRPLEKLSWKGYDGDAPFMVGSLTIAPTPEGYTILTFCEDFLVNTTKLLINEVEMENELVSVKKYIEEKYNKK
ncbi:MAG: SRPBCC family protein [Candidatus Ranarchaeia archaeon]